MHAWVCVCLLACFLPSMMEICTALRRVLGTLVKRGPCVMDGQLLLGTMPALNKYNIWKHTRISKKIVWQFPNSWCVFCRNSDLWISGGSLLILALCSITSFATFPLRKHWCHIIVVFTLDGCVHVIGYDTYREKWLWYLYLKRLPLKKRLLLDTVRTWLDFSNLIEKTNATAYSATRTWSIYIGQFVTVSSF